MTTKQPQTLAQCFAWLEQNLTEKQIRELRELSKDELWQTHFTLDKIVSEKLLKDNLALNEHLDKSAFCGDPDLASHIVTAFWDHLQMIDASGDKP